MTILPAWTWLAKTFQDHPKKVFLEVMPDVMMVMMFLHCEALLDIGQNMFFLACAKRNCSLHFFCSGRWDMSTPAPGPVFDFAPNNLYMFHADRTPTHNTHLCSTVCSQARNAHHALGSSHTDCSLIFVRLERICHLVRTCLTLCCSLTCRSPRAHHLPHSLFFSPRHKNTQHNRYNMNNSESHPLSGCSS